MSGAQSIGIYNFLLIYVLLLIVLFIMKRSKIEKTKLLLWASMKMTVQLVLAGFLLTYIFSNPKPIWTIGFVLTMLIFSIHRILNTEKNLNRRFKVGIAVSLSLSGLFILSYFILVIINEDLLNPQYTIPLAGMVIGNSMTGVSLGVKTFVNSLSTQRNKIQALQNLGVTPKDILKPFVNESLSTALLPTINSMLGMGIIFLPGMMTGQILAGTLPTTAILYQISIMIAICTSVCLSTFFSLTIGYRTLYNQRNQFEF